MSAIAQHPVAKLLAEAKITDVAIIDDLYDPPTRADLEEELEDFWQAATKDPTVSAELVTLAPGATAGSDLGDDAVQKLWQRYRTNDAIGKLAGEKVFTDRIAALAPLERLSTFLKKHGVTVAELGAGDELPEKPFRLVFLDYLLGPTPTHVSGASDGSAPDREEAINVSTRRAAAIYKDAKADAEKPFIVLMSSQPDGAVGRENFRRASKLLAGLFAFLPKQQLADEESIAVHLGTWAMGMESRHDIQRFVESIEGAMHKVVEEFVDRVRSLAFDDYANIQWMSLREDGHPLGDYMMWLYKSLLSQLLHSNVNVQTLKRLDGLAFTSFQPSEHGPSPELAHLYTCAITDPAVDGLGGHPRATANQTDPLLQTGDLFTAIEGSSVLLVITPACDLAYAPDANRPFPAEQTVLFVEGTLQSLDESPKGGMTTELFQHDGKAHRILWNMHRVRAVPYGKIMEFVKTENIARTGRLAPLFALEIQQAYSANLTRVGVPVRPPLARHLSVEVYCEGTDGKWHRHGTPIEKGAMVVRVREKNGDQEYMFIHPSCFHVLGTACKATSKVFEDQQTANAMLPPPDVNTPEGKAQMQARAKLAGKIGAIGKINTQIQNSGTALRVQRRLPESGKPILIVEGALKVYRQLALTDANSTEPIALLVGTDAGTEDPKAEGNV